jgi:hypothetical protein
VGRGHGGRRDGDGNPVATLTAEAGVLRVPVESIGTHTYELEEQR